MTGLACIARIGSAFGGICRIAGVFQLWLPVFASLKWKNVDKANWRKRDGEIAAKQSGQRGWNGMSTSKQTQ